MIFLYLSDIFVKTFFGRIFRQRRIPSSDLRYDRLNSFLIGTRVDKTSCVYLKDQIYAVAAVGCLFSRRGAEKEGLIKRSRSQSDFRVVDLELTADSRNLYLRALAAHEEYVQQRMQLFDSHEKQTMIDHLRPLYHPLHHETQSDVHSKEP